MALAFMFYVAPTRRWAATVIWASACAVGLLLLSASYFFHVGVFWQGMRHASFFDGTWRAFLMPGAYGQVISQLGQSSPALVAAVPAAIVTYLAWPRARYFGNTAPLSVAVIFLVLAIATPHYPGLGFNLMAVPFCLCLSLVSLRICWRHGSVGWYFPAFWVTGGKWRMERLGVGACERGVTEFRYQALGLILNELCRPVRQH